MQQVMTVKKESLFAKYPIFENPGFWVVSIGGFLIFSGLVWCAKPLETYRDAYPFNRNWSLSGSGIVTKCEGPFRSRKRGKLRYRIHFTWQVNDQPEKEYASIYYVPEFPCNPGDDVSILIYNNNPNISKIEGSYTTTQVFPDSVYFVFAVFIAYPIGWLWFIRLFPPPRKKKKRSQRGKVDHSKCLGNQKKGERRADIKDQGEGIASG